MQQLGQGRACSAAGGEDQGGWARLNYVLLPHVGSRLQGEEQRNLGPGRLTCRQWEAELPQGCTSLEVEGEAAEGWEHRVCIGRADVGAPREHSRAILATKASEPMLGTMQRRQPANGAEGRAGPHLP